MEDRMKLLVVSLLAGMPPGFMAAREVTPEDVRAMERMIKRGLSPTRQTPEDL